MRARRLANVRGGSGMNPARLKIADALRLIDEWTGPQGPAGVAAAVWHRG